MTPSGTDGRDHAPDLQRASSRRIWSRSSRRCCSSSRELGKEAERLQRAVASKAQGKARKLEAIAAAPTNVPAHDAGRARQATPTRSQSLSQTGQAARGRGRGLAGPLRRASGSEARSIILAEPARGHQRRLFKINRSRRAADRGQGSRCRSRRHGRRRAGNWGILSYTTPESNRRVNDRGGLARAPEGQAALVERGFDWRFFTSGDSREPELAGIRGA